MLLVLLLTKAIIVGNNSVSALTVNGMDIDDVDNFQYLGSYMSNYGDVTYDMCTRIGKASSVFRRLCPIWRSKNTKLCLYTSVVIPTAIYARETWKTTEKTRRMLDVFNRRCLRNILGISWKDHVTNADLLHRTGMMNLQDIVADRRRRFIGHILRLPLSRPASTALQWIPEGGNKPKGRPKKTWQDTLREDRRMMDVADNCEEAMMIANDRTRWQNLVAQCSYGNRRT